jgi:surface antigen
MKGNSMQRSIFFFSILLAASAAVASNFNFLHQAAPIAEFNKEDMDMFRATLRKALDEVKDGEKLAWQNEKTGSSGLVNPLKTLESENGACRNARIINKSRRKITENRFKFCKKDGKWLAVEILENN